LRIAFRRPALVGAGSSSTRLRVCKPDGTGAYGAPIEARCDAQTDVELKAAV